MDFCDVKKFSIIRAECLLCCYKFFSSFYWLHLTVFSQYFLKRYCIHNYSPGDAIMAIIVHMNYCFDLLGIDEAEMETEMGKMVLDLPSYP